MLNTSFVLGYLVRSVLVKGLWVNGICANNASSGLSFSKTSRGSVNIHLRSFQEAHVGEACLDERDCAMLKSILRFEVRHQ